MRTAQPPPVSPSHSHPSHARHPCCPLHPLQEPLPWDSHKYARSAAYSVLDLFPDHTLYDNLRFPNACILTKDNTGAAASPAAAAAATKPSLAAHVSNLAAPTAHAQRLVQMATASRDKRTGTGRKAAAAAAAAAAELEDSDVEVPQQHSASGSSSSDDDKPLIYRDSAQPQPSAARRQP